MNASTHESLVVSVDGSVIAVVRSDRFPEILGATDPFQQRMGTVRVWLARAVMFVATVGV